MSQAKVKKGFDCLEFKQQAQDKISLEIKNLSPVEQVEYFRQQAESSTLGQWWKSIKNHSTQLP
ncbi:hypothetical protein [Halotia branconii]|uniref:Uncharacterized protein n=1 Tax=Halotia branconii CENA392 TaxID=1539056 RepID=A0AAJ6PC92_9CYAN|nr:hypothetical protein [Halotia branconii]WGV28665.1 hypothetical protein QI031_14890 [Halotia branconii CENA392]